MIPGHCIYARNETGTCIAAHDAKLCALTPCPGALLGNLKENEHEEGECQKSSLGKLGN